MREPPLVPRSQLVTLPRKWTIGRIVWAAAQAVIYGFFVSSAILTAEAESLWALPILLLWVWVAIGTIEWMIGETIDLFRRWVRPVPDFATYARGAVGCLGMHHSISTEGALAA